MQSTPLVCFAVQIYWPWRQVHLTSDVAFSGHIFCMFYGLNYCFWPCLPVQAVSLTMQEQFEQARQRFSAFGRKGGAGLGAGPEVGGEVGTYI